MNQNYNKNGFVPGRIIVAFRRDSTYFNGLIPPFDKSPIINGFEIEGIEILHRPHGPSSIHPKSTKSDKDHYIVLMKLKNKKKQAVIEAISIIAQNPNVLYAEPDYLMHLDISPNDPRYRVLWGMRKIKVSKAWNKFTGSSNVVVGVIDSGIHYNHKDLKDNMWSDQSGCGICGWDFFYDNNDPMDENGHGTHVAGTIGAVGNNGIGVVGVNWNIKWLH